MALRRALQSRDNDLTWNVPSDTLSTQCPQRHPFVVGVEKDEVITLPPPGKNPSPTPHPFDWLQTQLREHKESSVPSFSLVLYHIYCSRWVLINIVLFRWGLGKRFGFVLSLRNYLHMSNNATLLVAHLKPSSVVAVQLFRTVRFSYVM